MSGHDVERARASSPLWCTRCRRTVIPAEVETVRLHRGSCGGPIRVRIDTAARPLAPAVLGCAHCGTTGGMRHIADWGGTRRYAECAGCGRVTCLVAGGSIAVSGPVHRYMHPNHEEDAG